MVDSMSNYDVNPPYFAYPYELWRYLSALLHRGEVIVGVRAGVRKLLITWQDFSDFACSGATYRVEQVTPPGAH